VAALFVPIVLVAATLSAVDAAAQDPARDASSVARIWEAERLDYGRRRCSTTRGCCRCSTRR